MERKEQTGHICRWMALGIMTIIRKTKCSRIFKRSASFSKTKRNFSKLSPYPKNLKKIDRLRRNFIHLKAVRTPS